MKPGTLFRIKWTHENAPYDEPGFAFAFDEYVFFQDNATAERLADESGVTVIEPEPEPLLDTKTYPFL